MIWQAIDRPRRVPLTATGAALVTTALDISLSFGGLYSQSLTVKSASDSGAGWAASCGDLPAAPARNVHTRSLISLGPAAQPVLRSKVGETPGKRAVDFVI
jgi:hypothetical protein